jgi:drug/metabolite transporter (DMT)-like permease
MANAFQKVEGGKLFPFLVLVVGVMGVSTGAIFAKIAEAHPFVKCAYRLSLASLAFWPVALLFHGGELRRLEKRDVAFTVLAGAFLALHFGTWMSSLDHTTVASSVMLVNTIPIWIALINIALGKGSPSQALWLCILLAVIGASIVGYGDLSFSKDALWGDLLALVGGVAAAAYIFCGGEARGKLSLPFYAAICYGVGALIMWCVSLAMKLRITGFPAGTWWAFIGMAVLSQVLGHSAYNWALRYFSTGFVSVALLGEPIGGAILAYFIFQEYPAGFKLVGLAMLLASIVMAARSEEKM